MAGSAYRIRLAAAGLAGLVAAGLYVGLALADVVPGGWRLRTLVVSPETLSARKRAAHRTERLESFRAEAIAPGGVLFIGSSTIEFFDLGAAFPGAPAINRGIGSEDLGGLRGRFLQTVHATRCSAVVLYAGSIDFRRYGSPPAELAGRVGRLIDQALVTHPDLRVTLIGILPERAMDEVMAGRLLRTNAALLALASGRDRVTFVATDRAPVVDPGTGLLETSASADALHLNGRGYEALASWLVTDDPALGARLRP